MRGFEIKIFLTPAGMVKDLKRTSIWKSSCAARIPVAK